MYEDRGQQTANCVDNLQRQLLLLNLRKTNLRSNFEDESQGTNVHVYCKQTEKLYGSEVCKF
jgi:hypothetical protein